MLSFIHMNSAQPSDKNKGFSFVELLIVVSLITLISGAALPGFNSYIKSQNLKQAAEQVASDLRTVQNKALGGVLSSDSSVVYWGAFPSSGFVSSNTFSELGAAQSNSEKASILPGHLVIRNDFLILFDMFKGNGYTLSGSPSSVTRCTETGSNCQIIVGLPDATTCSSILVNPAGAIIIQEGVLCE